MHDGDRLGHTGVLLYLDIVDSTMLTNEFAGRGSDGAEQLAELLNQYFARTFDIVAGYGGDVVKIDGDAVIALWYSEEEFADMDRLAFRAASAAVALQRDLCDLQPAKVVTLRQRIILITGEIKFIIFSELSGRRFFVVAGGLIGQLRDSSLRGKPDQIIVSDAMASLLGSSATVTRAECGAFELVEVESSAMKRAPSVTPAFPSIVGDQRLISDVTAFLPTVVVDRTAENQADWIAEFRKLTVIDVKLTNLDAEAPNIAARLQDAIRRIEAVVGPLRIPITNVVAGDKGLIVQIACGLPPHAQENTAVRAVQAALRIRPQLATIGVSVAIGVATGNAFCGIVGSENRCEYLSTGPVMSYAARLMQLAADNVLCDESTARAAAGQAVFSDAELVVVKGSTEPLSIRQIRERVPSHPFSDTGKRATFGRNAELLLFAERLAGMSEGRGGIAAIEAEPGAGKTHLLAHLGESARRLGYRVIAETTSQIEQTTAYFPFRAILTKLLFGDDANDVSIVKIRERLISLFRDPQFATRLSLLEDILPLELADKGLASEIRGSARLAGIEDLLVHIVVECATHSPLIIILDDLQWIDASSAHVLAAILRRAPGTLALIATRQVDTSTSQHVRSLLQSATPKIGLPRLPPEATRSIIQKHLSLLDVPSPLVKFVQARSEGLPFFAEQLLFALRDRRAFSVDNGTFRMLVSDLSLVETPDSLRDLIVSRVDRLPQSFQITIKVASVVGRVFDAETVRQVHPSNSNALALNDVFNQLVDAGLLSRVEESEHTKYAFRHLIIQDVTYDLVTYAQRRPLHRGIAQYIETKYAGALAPHYATLADHWERAADADRAIPFRVGAADMATQRYANEDALNHLDRVDRLIARFGARMPESTRAQCMRIRGDACQELTRFAEANALYRDLALFQQIPVPRTRPQMLIGITFESCRQALRRMRLIRFLSEGAEKKRDNLAAHIYMRFAEYAYFTNDTLFLAYCTLASLNRAERAAALPEIVNASGGLALGLAAVGLLRWANYYRDRSLELAITAGSRSAQGFAELLACVQCFHTGDWDRMSLHGMRGAVIWQELGDRYRNHCCLVIAAYQLLATGRYEFAERALQVFGERGEEIESTQVRAWALAARALLDLLVGRPAASASERIAIAMAASNLNPAECLLCDGISAAALLKAQDYLGALRAAESGLSILKKGSPAMAGALLFSVPSIAEVLLVLSDHATEVGRTRQELLSLCRLACLAAQRFARLNPICRPRASLLRGHLEGVRGRPRRMQANYRDALRDAQRLGLPLEQAMSHFALAQSSIACADRNEHQLCAQEILQRLGANWVPWSQFC